MIDYVNFDLFNGSSIDKQLTLTFTNGDVVTNTDIEAESMEITESINSEQQLTFGSCEASEFKITIHNVFASHVGQHVTVSMVLNGDTANPFTIGTYYVAEDRLTADRLKREITCYDELFLVLNTDVANWYNNTVFPSGVTTRKLSWIRNSFFSYFGITQETVTLPNDDMDVAKTIAPTSLSGKDVIKAICEINARFGHIGRDNKFHYIKLKEMIPGLYPADTLYPEDTLYPRGEAGANVIGEGGNYISCQYEDYEIKKVDKLVIRQEEGDIGAIIGSGTNAYIIQGNFLVYGKSAQDLTLIGNLIFDDVKAPFYRPADIEIVGNPCYEVGDGLRLQTTYDVVYAYIFKRVLKGVQALRDNYSCDGLEYRLEQVNSVNSQFIQQMQKTAKLRADVDEVSAELTEQLDDSIVGSYAYQTAQEIGLKVSKSNIVSDLDDEMSGITITSNSISFNSTGSLLINTNNVQMTANSFTFQGDMTGGSITGTTFTSTGTSGGATHTTEISGGIIETDVLKVTSGGTEIEMLPNAVTFRTSGSPTLTLGQGSITAHGVIQTDGNILGANVYSGNSLVLTVSDAPGKITALSGNTGTYGDYVSISINGVHYALPTGTWVQNYVDAHTNNS